MEEKFTLKAAFNAEFVGNIAKAFNKVHSEFNVAQFSKAVLDKQWADRELKERMRHIVLKLRDQLPGDYPKALNIVLLVAPKFEGLTAILFPDFLQVYGLDHFEESVKGLELVTPYSSSEFAVRPFIQKYPKRMMLVMQEWAHHENEHVRRLSSEGCRPRLPWSIALTIFKKDPAPVLPILEHLKADPSLYVRKSVANHLNDISKDHPELALETAERWLSDNHPDTNWIVKHAMRTLLKQGNKKALSLFGFGDTKAVGVTDLLIDRPQLRIGEDFRFSFNICWKGKSIVKLRIEYGIDYMKSNGKTNRKIFQIKEAEFNPNETVSITKKQSFQERTTRKHYIGKHNLAILVNGDQLAEFPFELVN